MKSLKRIIARGIISILTVVFVSSIVFPPTVSAAPAPASCGGKDYFLTFPAWHRGLKKPDCSIKSPSDLGGPEGDRLSKFIWIIVLNIIDIIIQLVAYIATGYVIWGGFTYLTSTGRPEKIKGAKEMILNAVIGLVIAIIAIAAVGYAAGRISA
jgi:hypothetical protein